MFLVKILRFFFGYVVFKGSGGFPERFLNLCAANSITVWDAKVSNGVLTAKTKIKCYKKMRHCARRSGMKMRIESKHGLPFVIRPYRKRKGLLVGIVLSAFALFLLNSSVWTIEVSGNDKYTDAQILNIAQRYGVGVGTAKRDVDLEKIRTQVKAEVSELNWFSVNMNGSHITLEVSEIKGDGKIYDRSTPCNIVSEVDGEVIKLDAYEGHAEVLPGSAILKGEILINGVIEKEDSAPIFVHARGEAIVRTRKNVSVKMPLKLAVTEISSVRVRKLPVFFGIEIPLTPSKAADCVRTEESMLMYNDKILPVGIKTEYEHHFEKNYKQLSARQAVLLAGYDSFVEEKDIMVNSETVEKQISVMENGNDVSVEIKYVNHQTTGVEQFMEISQFEKTAPINEIEDR